MDEKQTPKPERDDAEYWRGVREAGPDFWKNLPTTTIGPLTPEERAAINALAEQHEKAKRDGDNSDQSA